MKTTTLIKGRNDREERSEPDRRKMSLLDSIDSPEDLRKLDIPQLVQLAGEIRARIIDVVSRKGGHLAPSLGAVELTIALHYVFDTPRDKIIWDVGHQAYAHKLITGRRESFETLRQYKGISGFCRRDESPYDVFGAGHASTSISAALGIACARDLAGEDYKVIAVIGDGAMTGGLAFEGINNAGSLKKDIIVILNDNRMSISPNVGALSRYFTDVITGETYNRIKNDIWNLMGKLSRFGGGRLREVISELDKLVKSLIAPGIFFEKLGFRYFGPIDGHSHSHLINVFRQIKKLKGPILIHVYTTKGKGYSFAEVDARRFHGLGRFEKLTGVCTEGKEGLTFSEVFGKTLVEIAKDRKDVVAITAAMCDGTGLKPFSEAFPDRFYDVGIAEGHAVTFAAGLAVGGAKPVVAIYSTFLQRAFDHMIHDVALQNLPVVFAIDRGGLVGEDGPTHHGVFDLSYLRQIPNMTVMAPKDEDELRSMLRFAVDYNRGPIAIRYPRGSCKGYITSGDYSEIEYGRCEVMREGNDVTILAVGSMVWPSVEAADMLLKEGISASVVNMRFVKPLDAAFLRGLHGKVVTVEENSLEGGFGSAVVEFLKDNGIGDVKIKRLGIPDRFIEHGKRDILLREVELDREGIFRSVLSFIEGGG